MGIQSGSDYGLLSNSLYSILLLTVFAGVAIAVVSMLIKSFFGTPQFLATAVKWAEGRKWSAGTVLHTKSESRIQIGFGVIWIIDGLFQLRPDMPGGFVSQVATPALQGAPRLLIDVTNPILNLWLYHPVKVDLTSAWIQIVIGLGMILIRRGVSRRLILWLGVGWSLIVFLTGEGLGVFYPGASFLTGAPGAVLLYGFASFYLLQFESKRPWTRSRRAIAVPVAIFFAVGGILQALPGSPNWNRTGLTTMLAGMAASNQPSVFAKVVSAYANFASSNHVLANAIFVLLPLGAALCLLINAKSKKAIYLAIAVALAGWWIGNDFGIYSSTATDFNSGLPTIILLSALLGFGQPRVSQSEDGSGPTEAGSSETIVAPNGRGSLALLERPTDVMVVTKLPLLGFGVVSFAAGALFVSALISLVAMFGPVSGSMALVDSSGFVPIPPKLAPAFNLVSTTGRSVSLETLRGRPVLLTFLDPECYDTCPLMAQEMVKADALLGPKGKNVALVAVDANPFFTSTADTSAFSQSHGLSQIKNWYYLTGSRAQLAKVWSDYGIQVVPQRLGMVVHTQVYYFINSAGVEVGALQDTGNSQISGSYSTLIESHLKPLL